jgi:hypothetical protein
LYYKPIKMSKCEHGKYKQVCKECGGSQICEHDRIKAQCKECGGSSICEHDRIKAQCKECGGSGICEHDKRKAQCRECVGSAFCKHGKRKTQCKDCGGASICEHDKRKTECKDCGGSSICNHGKQKKQCRECGGSAFCKHGRLKAQCKECGGSGICEHDKQKAKCRECGGSGICEHGRQKAKCRECGGASFCKHDKWKTCCKECGGSSLCKSEHCETYGNPKYNGYCLPCCIQVCPEIEVSRNYKTKEKDVVDRIKATFPNFTWIADKKIKDGCSLRRPDLLLDMGSHIIIVEVDENQHNDYDCSCEHKRLMEISQDVSHRPIVFIRFNPDAYTNADGILVKSCWKLNKLGVMLIMKTKEKEWAERINSLKAQIQYWIDNPTEKIIEIIQLFY